jgi:hypothetical protein
VSQERSRSDANLGVQRALYITLRDHKVPELSFYGGGTAATTALKNATNVSKTLGVKGPYSVAHADKNVFVSWGAPPTGAHAHTIEACA